MQVRILSLLFLFLANVAVAVYSTAKSSYRSSDSIRYKEFKDGELCHGGQKHYTGWADIGHKHIFYWYHPVRNNTINAPILIWLQGGPGGSSLVGMLAENGPCLVSLDHNETVLNPHSWTEVYNVIYVDQPVGVGYSYVDDPSNDASYPNRSEDSALDFIALVRLLPEAFPELAGLPIHLSGESYAGRYVPVYAAAMLEYNLQVPAKARLPLRSIMVGNGLTNAGTQLPAGYDTGCFTHHGIPPIFNTTECAAMAVAAGRCEILQEQCEANPDELICAASGQYCVENLFDVIENVAIDRYNREKTCAPGDCYPIVDRVEGYMNSELVREMLEIDSAIPFEFDNWSMTSKTIEKRYYESSDFYTSSVPALQRVLIDPEVETLYYVGINDWMCNAIGVRRTLDNVRWERWAAFRAEPMHELPWKTSDGRIGGWTKAVAGLDYVELNGGGHLFPFDQPASALQLVTAWLEKIHRLDHDKVQKIRGQHANFRVQRGE